MVNEAYSMHVAYRNNKFIFTDNKTFTKTLRCPAERRKQVNSKGYFFSQDAYSRFSIRTFPTKEQPVKTDSQVGRRLWDSLWLEGWR